MNAPHRSTALALVGIALAGVALTGCSAIEEAFSRQESRTYDTLADAREDGVDAAWIPADATGIRLTRTTDAGAANATVLLESARELDPAVCAEVSRQSAPTYSIEGAPDVYKAETVYACGAWSVLAADGGWYGWTPNHPNEQTQSPAE